MQTPDFKKYFECPESQFVRKALDFFDGNQLCYMIQILNDTNKGRRDWEQKGMRALYRNITNMIVQKSGLLFIDGKPTITLYTQDENSPDLVQSEFLNQIYDESYWTEFMINVDSVVRLVKTAWVLQQFNPDTNQIIFDVLHKGNSHLECDPITRQPICMVYIVDECECGDVYYREFTVDTINDWVYQPNENGVGTYNLMSTQPNPYQCIPITICYDTNIPRSGWLVKAPRDLINLNEIYNLNLTDLEYAASWKVHQTLFTNCSILNEVADTVTSVEVWNSLLPRQQVQTQGVIGGLGSIVHIDSQGVDQPFIEYKGPNLDLTSSDELFNQWIKNYAYDWDVRVNVAGDGQANSGFQLVVEEMSNMELRKKRQRMFEMSIERMVKLTQRIWNTHFPLTFNVMNEVDVEFTDPTLPVDTQQQENVWKIRLDSHLLTPIDYYREVLGYEYQEAVVKWNEVNQFYNQGVDPQLVTDSTNQLQQEQTIETQVDNVVDTIITEDT